MATLAHVVAEMADSAEIAAFLDRFYLTLKLPVTIREGFRLAS